MTRQPALTIATVRSDFTEKFGIPRQSGLVSSTTSRIVFEPEFRSPDFVRGIDGFSHLWLIWEFSANVAAGWSATVRPPRLGGDERVGVFASRAPFRPNAMGLSSVELLGVELDSHEGPVLTIGGADLLDGTPILDIKPYVPTDARTHIRAGYLDSRPRNPLAVEFDSAAAERIPEAQRQTLVEILSHDPRPAYQADPGRVYGMTYAGHDVKFTVEGETLTVTEIRDLPAPDSSV
ncbi:tRNA (N6-threonylcarbamoyladenosine(37)-N6)-methyltransferase TrmO [Flaviflexus equikiangi]|uniref:tRNA (N6-threonylcarbamoyladenosine(37)-N6)-methyltransferase TrmO n=1 Tax=Flaviflexus equikiangi TaxID=2758573 RepID=UPI0015F55B37|nr:tRNA (N6-threonylcarbamoyladenosine(37)-N6)-methyltransferase TrmO [Flaviflexus equikiangi]